MNAPSITLITALLLATLTALQDMFCSTASYVCTDDFRRIVAYYYNSARAWGGEPGITFKRESL